MFNLSNELKQGSYVIKKIEGEPKYVQMLSYLGICNGSEIEVLGEGYFPGSVVVLVNNNRLQLNKDFMERIFVEKAKSLKKI